MLWAALLLQTSSSLLSSIDVRQRPVEAREAITRALADSRIADARQLASALADTWSDSFPLDQVTRFERMSPAQRRAKLAADSIRRAGNAALGSRGIAVAVTMWREALRRALAMGDTAGAAAAIGNIGTGFYRAEQLDSAETYLQRAHVLAESVGDKRTALNAFGALGAVANDRRDYEKAQASYSRALALRMRIGDFRGAAADHTNLGLISADLGQSDDARSHYNAALALGRAHDLAEAKATALLNLANLESVEGNYSAAHASYSEALGLYRALGSDADVALVLHNLGLLSTRRGDYPAARKQLQQARRQYQELDATHEVVQVLRDLALVEAAQGDLRAALENLRLAEQSVSASDGYDLRAAIALARADLSVHLNLLAEADRHYARARSQYRRAGDAIGEAEALQGHARLLIERKQYPRALDELAAAMRVLEAAGDARPLALTRLLIGRARQLQGDTAEARRILRQALDTLHSLGDVAAEAYALGALGDLELESGAGSSLAAESWYRRALSVISAKPNPALSWQLHAQLGRALRNRRALADAARELTTAIGEVETMTAGMRSSDQRAVFFADKWDVYADLALVERERGNVAAAFDVSERMRSRRVLALLQQGRLASSPRRDTALERRAQDLRSRITELTARLEDEEGRVTDLRGPDLSSRSGVTREALSRAQDQYAQLLMEADGRGDAALPRSGTATWRNVAARLQRGQLLLSYVVTDSTTFVFVVTRDSVSSLDLNVPRRELASLVEFARGTIARADGWRAPLRRLHQLLIAPVSNAGLLDGVQRLVIVPYAELHYLPFAALLDRDTFLVERFDITFAPSASAWIRLGDRPAPKATRVLALAPRTRELPGSRGEVDAMRAVYGSDATVLTGRSASERTLRATSGGYGILHLATFGVLNQHNPLFSFVQLAEGGDDDGRLEVHEVFGLSLDARLVVLSACQTALASGAIADVPAGDDWVGLAQAFLTAGARKVIATLWAVEDQATAQVMSRLHRHLRDGASEADALAQAQRETLRNPATASPFYWAGFTLTGGE